MTRAATTCVIFDCDGTLVDGQASICEAMEAAFAGAALAAPSRNAIRRIVGLSLPYLGCVDMLGRQLHGNTMVFGLAVTSFGWLGLVWLTKSQLLREARSTVLMVYGSIAVAAMVLRVLFEGGTAADLQPWHQLMDYSGPLLMAAVLAITTYHTRSLLPAAMAAV